MTEGDLAGMAWPRPWRAVPAGEADGLARQLRHEVAASHRLHGRGARVIGRSEASDDIALALDGGGYAIVHLTWASQPMPMPEVFPATSFYADAAALLAGLKDDADDGADEP